MRSAIKHKLLPALIITCMGFGPVACGDDDDGDGASGSGGSGGAKAGAGGAKAGSGGAGGAKAGSGGGGTGGAAHGGTGGHGTTSGTGGAASTDDGGVPDTNVDSEAADLRVTLNLLLSEHITFAAKATGAALGARTEEYDAYAALLNSNGTAIGDLVGAAYGDTAKSTFNGIWSAHNGFFVDYTTAVATNDTEKRDTAVSNLTTVYVPQFAKFLADATGLPQATLATLTTDHVLTTKAVVDAQAAKDWPTAYTKFREAFAHMRMIGDPLSEAIAAQMATKFPGDATTDSVDLRVTLNEAFQEHVYLATFATAAALGGDTRTGEFGAAGEALNANGTDIGDAIGSLYGNDAKTQFNGIWSAHNGFFVDYTTGVATDDTTKKDAAVSSLLNTYVPNFVALLHGATDLPTDTLTTLTTAHVTQTKAVVDAQGDANFAGAASADQEAARHMQMIADPVSIAIVAKLSDKF